MRLVQLYEDAPDDPVELLKDIQRENTEGLFDPKMISAAYDSWRNSHFGDDYLAYEELRGYIDAATERYKKGGKIYRLIFAKDEASIDTTNLGDHWTFSSWKIRDFIEGGSFLSNPDYHDLDMFMITAQVAPKSITIPDSWASYPEEQELGITGMNAIQDYKIEPYQY